MYSNNTALATDGRHWYIVLTDAPSQTKLPIDMKPTHHKTHVANKLKLNKKPLSVPLVANWHSSKQGKPSLDR